MCLAQRSSQWLLDKLSFIIVIVITTTTIILQYYLCIKLKHTLMQRQLLFLGWLHQKFINIKKYFSAVVLKATHDSFSYLSLLINVLTFKNYSIFMVFMWEKKTRIQNFKSIFLSLLFFQLNIMKNNGVYVIHFNTELLYINSSIV